MCVKKRRKREDVPVAGLSMQSPMLSLSVLRKEEEKKGRTRCGIEHVVSHALLDFFFIFFFFKKGAPVAGLSM